MSMSRTEQLFDAMRANANAAAKNEALIAELAGRIAKNQRALKARKKYLWLDPDDPSKLHAAIDGKNAEVREAQHARVCEADHEVKRLREALDADDAMLHVARATLSGTKRDIQAIETELATIRAEINARAAEHFGRLVTVNGARKSPAEAAV